MKAKRACLYLRVSTSTKSQHGEAIAFDQDPAVQEQPLRALADQRGWNVVKVYSDRASGAKERRPGLDALMADARRGAFDVVAVWRFDRLARRSIGILYGRFSGSSQRRSMGKSGFNASRDA